MLDEVGLHQVVEDVILADPLHGAAAGGTKGGALHPAGVAGGAERVHAGLQAEGRDTQGGERVRHGPVARGRRSCSFNLNADYPGVNYTFYWQVILPNEKAIANLADAFIQAGNSHLSILSQSKSESHSSSAISPFIEFQDCGTPSAG